MADEDISFPVINIEECKGCQRCITGCPQNAILLSQDMNNAGYQYAYYSGNGCTGCKDCYFTCPEPLALEVHQYKKVVDDEVSKMIKAKVANKGGE
ncbi:4Fe-4S dicluster domain-containing protein [Methanobrevibacter millerae]|uniref:4Fe-4S dicluster domain-containing protein n=1 Tax=Methanobrevibacter millerae TaxID=230361 RepID=A0A8T3V8P6_9EURY|nr:4Fe-4S dicluster domain-containing protein [Methanobrevibacter millerae]MBE6504439.1 4Fe-4S dicluster domain-containing protein [Methanobrevibacter millerae]MBQ6345599.1 4Fe-4S dicluster domain-containing protein [Methanobrevibacter sp.]MBR0370113.1 4Fe-4S dicluster domain-containing protein [Methanobrevibacter sp.]